ncbi:hypothetical protein ABW99_03995 [Pandoraea thiooxydans]|uniref:Probable chemoreceptor glutamine deamidase CheD n=1 Tax=Pandoraea thiooxydans TaxID=445709 RepID=A0A0G3ES61_9BURK|nr:chemotaxis protein CheD [Pandoraea thiooxydans]AKJ67516.1 hypothetical protein ABW99_03995 [Pandoraea thiooxydans]
MPSTHEIQVHMCKIAIGRGCDGNVLRTTLGSCVGIGLLWRERDLYGLAHCLLPDSAPGAPRPVAPGAKYVTQAVPSLLSMMHAWHAPPDALEAVLAGGANMVHYVSTPRHAPIGELNVRTAQKLLAEHGVRVVHLDVGGDCGRQLSIDCARHEYAVKTISRFA